MYRAAKKAGEISRGQPKKNCQDDGQYFRVKLDDIGIDRNLSSRSQKVGGIGEQAFEAVVANVRQRIADQSGRVSLDVTAVDKKQRQRRIAAAAE